MNPQLSSLAALAALMLAPLAAHAQSTVIAQDNAADAAYANGYAGQNGGFGFGAFSVAASGLSAGTFVASASESEGGPQYNNNAAAIDTGGKSFGSYANSGSGGGGDHSDSAVTITRGFSAGPTAGDTFSLDFVSGYNDGKNADGSAGGGTAGVSLTDAAGTFGTFSYQSNNEYLFNGSQIPGLNYATGPIHLVYDITSATTYSLQATGAVSFSGTGTFAGPVSGFQVQQVNAGPGDGSHNAYFNNLSENGPASAAPEPSQLGVLLLVCLGGAALIARKRAATCA